MRYDEDKEIFRVAQYIYAEQVRHYERKGSYMRRPFNKDAAEGLTRSRRLFPNGDHNNYPQNFRYRCAPCHDGTGFCIFFEKLEAGVVYAKILRFRSFHDSEESDWTETGWNYTDAEFTSKPSDIAKRIKGKFSAPLDDNDAAIFEELSSRYLYASRLPKGSQGKPLLYFSLGFDPRYITMAKACLRSISVHTSHKFKLDVLLISDSDAVQREFERTFCNFRFHTFEVPPARDGIEASMQKLRVFEWENIWEYSDVLYLDADIVFDDVDIREAFRLKLDPSKIHSVIHDGAVLETHRTVFHTIKSYDKEELERFREAKLMPFNAGQFMFKVNECMSQHFSNVSWLSRTWQKQFFFEQSYLNYYFNSNLASDTTVMSPIFSLFYIGQDAIASLERKSKKVVHYAGEACDSRTKIEFLMRHYNKYHIDP